MVTIFDTNITSDVPLWWTYDVMTKAEMQAICERLNLYVSKNVKKQEMAKRLADEVVSNPAEVYALISKTEFALLTEFIEAGPDKYVVLKARKMPFMLQKLGLVLTYEDEEKGEWHMIMPDEVRKSLEPDYAFYRSLHESGRPIPSARELRMMGMLSQLLGKCPK